MTCHIARAPSHVAEVLRLAPNDQPWRIRRAVPGTTSAQILILSALDAVVVHGRHRGAPPGRARPIEQPRRRATGLGCRHRSVELDRLDRVRDLWQVRSPANPQSDLLQPALQVAGELHWRNQGGAQALRPLWRSIRGQDSRGEVLLAACARWRQARNGCELTCGNGAPRAAASTSMIGIARSAADRSPRAATSCRDSARRLPASARPAPLETGRLPAAQGEWRNGHADRTATAMLMIPEVMTAIMKIRRQLGLVRREEPRWPPRQQLQEARRRSPRRWSPHATGLKPGGRARHAKGRRPARRRPP